MYQLRKLNKAKHVLILTLCWFYSNCPIYFTTADVKCCVAVVKCCPVLNFSVVIFFWSFGIIDVSTIKCCDLSTAQAGARGVRDVAVFFVPHV
jgi:hypothetical protein